MKTAGARADFYFEFSRGEGPEEVWLPRVPEWEHSPLIAFMLTVRVTVAPEQAGRANWRVTHTSVLIHRHNIKKDGTEGARESSRYANVSDELFRYFREQAQVAALEEITAAVGRAG